MKSAVIKSCCELKRVFVHVRFTVCKEVRERNRVRQRGREEEEAGGGVLPEGECRNIEQAVLI